MLSEASFSLSSICCLFQLSVRLNPTEGGGECKACMTQRDTADTQKAENQINTMSQPRNTSGGTFTYQVTKVHLSKVVETS